MKPKICLLILSVFLFPFVLKAQDIGGLLKLIQPQFTAQNNAFFAEMQRQNIAFITSKVVFCGGYVCTFEIIEPRIYRHIHLKRDRRKMSQCFLMKTGDFSAQIVYILGKNFIYIT